MECFIYFHQNYLLQMKLKFPTIKTSLNYLGFIINEAQIKHTNLKY